MSKSSKWVAVAAVAVVAVVATVVVLLISSGSDSRVAAEGAPSPTSPAPSASASPSESPSESPSPEDPASSAAGAPQAAASPEPSPTTTVNGVVLPDAQVAPPVAFEEDAQILPDFTAEVVSVESIDGVGQGIGEISGPALKFTVALTNNTSAPMETVGVVVNAYGANAAPAIPLYGDPNAEALPDVVAPGQTVRGVYVFTLPKDNRDPVTLTVAFDPATPTVVFTGRL